MDQYRIDSHKLIYHPARVADWLGGKDIYPLYVEIAPFGGCNHRCIFCALDYMGYKPLAFDTAVLKRFLKGIAGRGIKSIMFAGEGEPLLHKDIAELVKYAADCGLDIAMTTNGAKLSQGTAKKILPYLSWLRISLNAGTPRTYARVHRTSPADFQRVIENIKAAVRMKKENKYACTIGAQFLLLNENYREAVVLAEILRGIGADYLIIKPYSQHPSSINRLKSRLDYSKLLFVENKLQNYARGDFRVIFRKNTMLKIKEKKPYAKCFGLTFWAYLAANGDLYACSAFLGDKRFVYGNVYRQPFDKIWKGKKRRQIMRLMQDRWDIADCREVCRLDEVNRYLWELRHPAQHVNFI